MSGLSDARRQIFSPPYPGLPAAVFAYFVVCFALHPFSPFFTHHLADPDDYMRLNEVIGWLQGQSWYDLSMPRLSPGAHTVVHWSRLIDVPIALIAWPFIPLLGVADAVLAAALIVPLLWFAVLLALLAAWARLVVGRDRAPLACVMALFAPMLLFNFTPGRVDHHGVQAIIAGFGVLCFARIITNDKGRLFAALAAFAFACGFWIGAEALPWAIVFIACLGVAAAWQGGSVARDAAVFGVCLPLFTTALIPAALPAAEFSSRALSWFSPAYAIFAALAGGVLVVGWIGMRRGVGRGEGGKSNVCCYVPAVQKSLLRGLFSVPSASANGSPPSLTLPARGRGMVLYALLGLAAASAFFALVPSALRGPFTDYDTFDATTALDNITEAQPLIRSLHIDRFRPATLIPAGLLFARLLALPLLALGVCFWFARTARDEKRLIWLAQGVFLAAALALTIFWQRRVGVFMELFSLVPLTQLLCAWGDRARGALRDRSLFWAEIGVFLALGALPVVLLPAIADKTPFYPDIVLFPAARGAAVCPLEPLIPWLNNAAITGGKALTLMNTSDAGPQLLFATRHNAVAGNFDVAGNADAFAFFRATDDAAARDAARKWNADWVVLCKTAPTLYLGADYGKPGHIQVRLGQDGLLRLVNTDKNQPLIARLINGAPPAWLKPIEIPDATDYLVFRIQDTAGKK